MKWRYLHSAQPPPPVPRKRGLGRSYTSTIDAAGDTSSANQAGSGTISIHKDGSGTFDSGNVTLVTGGSAIVTIDAGSTAQPQLYYFIQQTAAAN